MKKYSNTSVYSRTPFSDFYLDTLELPEIKPHADDILLTLRTVYNHRPDLLASDIYKDPRLWWVFSVRNPNVLDDPIWDFIANQQIYVPTPIRIKDLLNL